MSRSRAPITSFFTAAFTAGWAAALCAVACGGSEISRGFALEIDGLSARAETVVVKLFPASRGQACSGLGLDNALSVSAPIESRWVRSSAAPRRFELPAIDEESLTLFVFAVAPDGTAIQFACTTITFEEIGGLTAGTKVVTLSRRTPDPS